MSARPRCVVAEDQYLLRDGLTHLLTAHGFDVVEAVGTGPELERALRAHRPDVSVVDVRMPPTLTDEGLQVSLAVRRDIPGLPILVLSQHVEQLYARELLADGAGAIGYLLKDRVFNADQFIDAVRRVAGGGTAMDPEVIAKLVAGNASDPLAALTPREREVLGLMAEGCSNAAIAGRLHFSEGAVGKHTANIFAKLGIVASDDTNRRVLAVLAYLGS
ncbi:response regulator transcription factor [Amycolatopsis sp. BJA-103]|uniref:response regulator n=1 Tax=unclassified Amycolatopsis TaxID=2618356 RepID=UPI000C759F44|nr:response regulator transcription factor [Amycolatopsis sp. BJA-103]AUI62712.1 DNA-binding response regulator [Amycolatopsis sp. BJA-103]PNE18551.1 DNA-binding response regulator [Amycolatopsis sp. BJA-103]